jgi:hypothetical protein
MGRGKWTGGVGRGDKSFKNPEYDASPRLLFMQSNGGLTDAALFQGKDSILSGPAGGLLARCKLVFRLVFLKLLALIWGVPRRMYRTTAVNMSARLRLRLRA